MNNRVQLYFYSALIKHNGMEKRFQNSKNSVFDSSRIESSTVNMKSIDYRL